MTQLLWRKYTEWPLLAVAILFSPPIRRRSSSICHRTNNALGTVVWITWGIFGADYLANLVLAENRRRWFVRNTHELVILSLPVLRPLRLLRLVTLLKVLHRTADRSLRGRVSAP